VLDIIGRRRQPAGNADPGPGPVPPPDPRIFRDLRFSYYQAIRKATAQEIETIDMARRGVHNEAAEMLLERLDIKGKVETDGQREIRHRTARSLP
jgi:uncharacterized protein (UPF0262 family)